MPQRISINIAEDTRKFTAFLTKAKSDPGIMVAFLDDPVGSVKSAGVRMDAYASTSEEHKAVVDRFRRDVKLIASVDLKKRLGGIVAKTAAIQSTETGAIYNFDASSSSTVNYESMTSTTRGAFSDTNTSEVAETDTHFAGIDIDRLGDLMKGPLLSAAAMSSIKTRFAQSLRSMRS